MSNRINYGNFPYTAPLEYPFPWGVYSWLGDYIKDSLTFNWNTAGFGSWVDFYGYKIFTLHHTGALPVSYIVDSVNFTSDSEAAFLKAEDTYWDFFASSRDPNLNRAAQYAALHLIFRKYEIIADREEPKISNDLYQKRWKTLEQETVSALNSAAKNSRKSISDLVSTLENIQCLSSFKTKALYDWSERKESIVSKINKYQSSTSQSLHDIALFLVDRRTYFTTNPAYKSLQTEIENFTDKAEEFYSKRDKHIANLEYCYDLSQRGFQYSLPCDIEDIQNRQAIIEKEKEKLIQRKNDIDKLNQEFINFATNTNDFNIAVEVFGNCSKAWKGIVAAQKDFSYGFIKTPSIVVSQDNQYRFYGGHNLDGRSIRVVPDKTVQLGQFHYDAKKDILRINPKDNANAGNVAREFERLRKKYLTGSSSYKRRVDTRIRTALTQPVKPVLPIKTALALKTPVNRNMRGFGSARLDFDRNLINSGYPIELSAIETQRFTQMAEFSKAQVIVQKTGSGHRVIYAQKGKLIAQETSNQGAFQRTVEQVVDRASRDLPNNKKNVVIVSDRSMTKGDMKALHLVANSRQAAVAESGGGGNRNFVDILGTGFSEGGGKPPPNFGSRGSSGNGGGGGRGRGFFSGKDGHPLFILAGLTRKGKSILARTDVNWGAAIVKSEKIISKKKKGVVILKIEVPFKEASQGGIFRMLRLRIASFFKRKPVKNDVDILSSVINESFAKDLPNSTVADRIKLIRQNYKSQVGEDADLRFRLQEGVQDMHIVELFEKVEPRG